MARINGSAEVMRHFPKPLSPEENAQWIESIEERFETDGFGFWAVVRRDTGELIGAAGLARIRYGAHFTPAVEVGWRLAREAWGQGLDEIIAVTVPVNVPSQKVMERLGMKRDWSANFLHPKVPEGHPLRQHWLWRIQRPA